MPYFPAEVDAFNILKSKQNAKARRWLVANETVSTSDDSVKNKKWSTLSGAGRVSIRVVVMRCVYLSRLVSGEQRQQNLMQNALCFKSSFINPLFCFKFALFWITFAGVSFNRACMGVWRSWKNIYTIMQMHRGANREAEVNERNNCKQYLFHATPGVEPDSLLNNPISLHLK